MGRALVDSTVLLVVVLLVWLPMRKRLSAQFAHGLFLLVLLKLAVPIPVSWPSWTAGPSLRRAADRVADWALAAPTAATSPSAPNALATEAGEDPIVVATPAPEPIVAAPEPRPASEP